MKLFFIFCFSIFIFSSCTIEKRLYLKGFHISHKKNRALNSIKPDFSKQTENLSLKNLDTIQNQDISLLQEITIEENEKNVEYNNFFENEIDSTLKNKLEATPAMNISFFSDFCKQVTGKDEKIVNKSETVNQISEETKIRRLNIFSLIASALGIFLIMLTGLSFFMGILTLILCIISFRKSKLLKQKRNKLSVILLIISVLMVIAPWIILLLRPGEFLIEVVVYGLGPLGW